jgi:hydrogenase maturation protein HypF
MFSSIARGLPEIGLMLPYTPIHHLLFDNAPYDLLVMTSANSNGEPMCTEDTEVVGSVGDTVDAILTHNRSIVVRLDDSVVRPMKNGPVLLRRGRGYVPSSCKAPFNVDGIVGLGAQMKNSIAIGREKSCCISEYMGTTDSSAVIDECWKTFQRLLGILNIKPRLIVSDIHPSGLSGYFSDGSIPIITVQHHHAHAAACMGENNVTGKTICVVYDGTGLGEDGSIWGSEILIADYTTYTRIGHLNEMQLVGNDAAIENPGRMAIAICAEKMAGQIEKIVPWISIDECMAVVSLINKPSFTTPTTSMGRLFDSCAAILDICRKRTYEGQPAIELEGAADTYCRDFYPIGLLKTDNKIIMDGQRLLLSVIEDRDKGISNSIIAARFHNTIAIMTIESVKAIAERTGIGQVALSGGCFCNKLLFERIFEGLTDNGLQVYSHHRLPPGDENISYGQVLIAASPPAHLCKERRGEQECE